MADAAHEGTDKTLRALERHINKLYAQARRQIRKEVEPLVDGIYLEDEDATQQQRVDYAERHNLAGIKAALVSILVLTNGKAFRSINNAMGDVYALNYGYIEKTVYAQTGKKMKDAATPALSTILSRHDKRAYKKAVDSKLVSRQVMRVIKKGLKQGSGIPTIARDIRKVSNYSKNRAITTARTEATRVENRGRLDAMERANRMGIRIKERWLSASDSLTRDSHRAINGEVIELGGTFSNGLRYPGDPSGPASEVCNCRCTITSVIEV